MELKVRIQRLTRRFWFVPSLIVAAGIALALITVELDHRYFADLQLHAFWLFGGKSSAARSLLSTIANSVMTVVAVAFSITIVATQQAATQYSPRVLERFSSDRPNQVVLGTYLGTFVYALMVLRDVRADGDGESAAFIPAFSVVVALALTVISAGMLVYFIHHITQALQASTILMSIRRELDHQLESLYPEEFPTDGKEPESFAQARDRLEDERGAPRFVVRARQEGYLSRVKIPELTEAIRGGRFAALRVDLEVGSYVTPGTPLIVAWTPGPADTVTLPEDAIVERIRECFHIETDRSIFQDPLYGIRQMTDVAIKALSPGINDPTTAEECLVQLHGALVRLARKELPASRTECEGTTLVVRRPGFDQYLANSYDQIWYNTANAPHVALTMVDDFRKLAELCPSSDRRRLIARRLERMRDEIPRIHFDEWARPLLQARIDEALRATGGDPSGTRAAA